MNSKILNLSDFYSLYKDWVCRNPQTAGELETAVKWLSYFVAGKINKSMVLTELVYSASNLLVLFNDLIIQSEKQKIGSSTDQIKIWLTVLEYSQVFIEVSVRSVWGEKGRWMVIAFVQLLKFAARMSLLLHYKEALLSCPPVLPCDRSQRDGSKTAKVDNIAFCLKRSGRVVRKVDAAPPTNNRLWKPPVLQNQKFMNNNLGEKPFKTLLQQHLIGELLYIVKPIANLGLMLKYGRNTWKPWTISAVLDFVSLYLLLSKTKQPVKLSSTQQLEISRRKITLLLYLMRSPFYEKHSKSRIDSFLNVVCRNVPLGRHIIIPILKFLPHWQETYFYLWSS